MKIFKFGKFYNKKKLFLCVFLIIVLFFASTHSTKKVKPVSATIAGGPYHLMVINDKCELYSWGDNYEGVIAPDLGEKVGYLKSPYEAHRIMNNVSSIATSQYGSFAIDENNGLWAWGSNVQISRDNYNTEKHYYPIMKIMDNVAMVSAGTHHHLAVKKDGSLWGWGAYYYGQLGDGRYNRYLVDGIGDIYDAGAYTQQYEDNPIKVLNDVCYAVAVGDCSFVIKNDDSLWAWGYNENGELGDGTATTRTSPVKIMEKVRFIAPGPYAIRMDGSLWTWGLGESHNENKKIAKSDLLPKKIMDNVIFASKFDGGQSIAIQEDGSFWIWGKNNFGQLGDGTEISRDEPAKIMDDVVYAAGNTFSTLALNKDGSLWHMGLYNDAGDSPNYLPHKIMDDIMLPKEISFSDALDKLDTGVLP